MASFTDKPIAFTPYIQQLPVEQMYQVGATKQALYNQGLQRIQSQIDSVAGLDIARDVDKAYLQSKMDSLGNSLKFVAAGDFSDFQLVNSVGGMVNQVSKDENIMNAVNSTTWYRKQLQAMENDAEEGKANPANNLHFMKRVDAWLNSNKVGEKFGASYIHPVDVWGKIKDVAKEVGVDASDIQQLYETDGNGNVLFDPQTGGAKWNPIMAEKILKGKDPDKVLAAFQAALTPADYQQLAIDGEYQMASLSPEDLRQKIINNSNAQVNDLTSKIDAIKINLFEERGKNNKDYERISSLENQLNYFNKLSDQIIKSANSSIETLTTNPDAVRGSLYTNSYLYSMSQALSSHESATKYSVSPAWTVYTNIRDFNYKMQQDALKHEEWMYEQGLKTGGGFSPEFITGTVKDEDIQKAKMAYKQGLDADVQRLDSLNEEIARSYLKGINPIQGGESIDVYNKRITQELINRKNRGETPDKIAAVQLEKWNKTPDKIKAEYRELIRQQKELVTNIQDRQDEVDGITSQAKEILRSQGIEEPETKISRNIDQTGTAVGAPTGITGPIWIPKIFSTEYDKYLEKLNDIENDLYKESGVIPQPIGETVERGKLPKEDWIGKVSLVVGAYEGDYNDTPNFSEAKMQEALASDKMNALALWIEPGAGYGNEIKYKLKIETPDKESREMYISQQHYEYLSGHRAPVNMMKPQVLKRVDKYGTTNLSGSENPQMARFGMDDFINLNSDKYTATGDLIADKANPENVWLRIYLFDKKTGDYIEPLTFPDPRDSRYGIPTKLEDGSYNPAIQYQIEGINSDVIEQLQNR